MIRAEPTLIWGKPSVTIVGSVRRASLWGTEVLRVWLQLWLHRPVTALTPSGSHTYSRRGLSCNLQFNGTP